MNPWIRFSPLLGFLQETWGLKDELEKEASGTSAFKDCLRGNEAQTSGPRATQPVEAAPFTDHFQLTWFRGKGNVKYLETLRKKKNPL